MLAPRSEPASPALVAACHGDPSSAVVAATEWTTSAALLRATHRRCANCKGVFVKELASCSHCHSPADHFSFTAPAGELAGLARLYLYLARAASSTRRMGRVVTLQGREQPVRLARLDLSGKFIGNKASFVIFKFRKCRGKYAYPSQKVALAPREISG